MNPLARLRLSLRIWWDVGFPWRVRTSLQFARFAWLALTRHFGIMDAKEARARGGYNYLVLTLSYFPVSAAHRYLTPTEAATPPGAEP